jgi:[calcium/calmodulin-dependent protein kinase] kinase
VPTLLSATDLKPENILLSSEGRVMIADFGVAHYFKEEEGKERRPVKELSRSMSRGQITRTEGTFSFWAPEMCEGSGTFSAYACDLWAVGICAFCMIFGAPPFAGDNAVALFENIQKNPLVLPGPLSDQGGRFLRGILAKSPKERFTLADALGHPWLEQARSSDPRKVAKILPPSDEEMARAFSPAKDFIMHSSSGMFQPMRRRTNNDPADDVESSDERAFDDGKRRRCLVM